MFHAIFVISLLCFVWFGGGAGTKTLGFVGFSNEVIYISPSFPPDASKWEEDAWGLNCSPFTPPFLCLFISVSCGCGCLFFSYAAFLRSTF